MIKHRNRYFVRNRDGEPRTIVAKVLSVKPADLGNKKKSVSVTKYHVLDEVTRAHYKFITVGHDLPDAKRHDIIDVTLSPDKRYIFRPDYKGVTDTFDKDQDIAKAVAIALTFYLWPLLTKYYKCEELDVRPNTKIFGVGLSRTGTTSLSSALSILGYNSLHNPSRMMWLHNDNLGINNYYADGLDALIDTPIPLFYEELDNAYSDSKFILTVRDPEEWAESAKKHFTKTRAMIRSLTHGKEIKRYLNELYGSEVFNEETWVRAFIEHEQRVKEYFADRPEDLLVLDVCGGQGWDELCSFLDTREPYIPFPHKSKKENFVKHSLIDYVRDIYYLRDSRRG